MGLRTSFETPPFEFLRTGFGAPQHERVTWVSVRPVTAYGKNPKSKFAAVQ